MGTIWHSPEARSILYSQVCPAGLIRVLWNNVNLVFTNVLFLLNHIQCSFTPES